MSITILKPATGSTVGCVLDITVTTTKPPFTITFDQTTLYGGNCKPIVGPPPPGRTSPPIRLARAIAEIDADTTISEETKLAQKKQRPPALRGGVAKKRISLCDFFPQSQLCKGQVIGITVTDAAGNTDSITVTVGPAGAVNGGKRCDCPGNQ